MADILKITTPLVNKNPQVAPKPAPEPTTPFQLHDLSRVMKPFNQRDILAQNNTLLKESDSPEILLDLLKDPGVTVTYLKNIFMLEEIFKLLPHNNQTLTKEIESLYQHLLLPHGEIADELVRQEQESTVFRGEFFDFLRGLNNANFARTDIRYAVINLMRSINNLMVKDDVMDAVGNSLTFLAKNLQPSRSLAQKLEILAFRFRQPGSDELFATLKAEALEVLKEVEESVLFSPQLQKMASITIYNLSRYNDSLDYFHDAAGSLWQKLAGEDRALFARYVNALMEFFRENEIGREPGAAPGQGGQAMQGQAAGGAGIPQALAGTMAGEEGDPEAELASASAYGGAGAGAAATAQGAPMHTAVPGSMGAMAQAEQEDALAVAARGTSSKVMDALIEMIQKQSEADEAGKGEIGQVDKIIHSLLSSPCNFTPLLHFIIPAFFGDVKAFAEIWINPYDDEEGAQGVAAGRRIHILMVVDVEILGRFEAELKVRDRIVDIYLHCPEGLEGRFAGMLAELPAKMRGLDTPYRLGRMEVETLGHSRSLMEVFKTLPYKRMGVDIRV